MDIATGWEESGRIRVYLNPGPDKATRAWPAVTVGEVASPEDAFFIDLDNDGFLEVVSSCEGRTRQIYIHWAPDNPRELLNPAAWRTEPFPAAENQMWMYAVAYPHDGRDTLIIGAKGQGATVTWFTPASSGSWKTQRLYNAGWIMSLIPADLNADGRPDLLISDRRGPSRGLKWLERHPDSSWIEHPIGLAGKEVMFADLADLDGDSRKDAVVAVKPRRVSFLFQPEDPATPWRELSLDLPATLGTAKAVRVGDLDSDDHPDLVFTCEGAEAPLAGVAWIELKHGSFTEFDLHDISGPEGIKFDRIELLDMDGDGDLDVLTCEETAKLGVIWYENPFR